ncbi:cobalamin B12-binding domain-containing protein [Clostridium algidicarnis]|uniref:cobalamin B12-binding domain-containing protein n=1 Tax=Clostridium algidicarnis TaxID=37659 RepID=UPI001C0AED03|nr:cobalamin-dependent protein [Clostridium algidicarnis]MBU3193034.1 cobalamin-dependent protein [Clostridium algidicarnis]
MNAYYDEFLHMLDEEDKEGCVKFVLSKLESGKIDVINLYTKILEPSLNNMTCKLNEKTICVWKEHVRTSIVRTILECSYPYILKEINKNGIKQDKGRLVVVCPPEEHHEIGALMAADFFLMNGFDTIYVGSNTPKEDFIKAIDYIKPKYVDISITNYYNLIAAKNIIQEIKNTNKYQGEILVGGYAFNSNPDVYKQIGADRLLQTYQDIKSFGEEKHYEASL